MSVGLSVLSFNVWGLFAAQHNQRRMEHIADRLGVYDIVCLQEQFRESDACTLLRGGHHPFTFRAWSSPIGSGLLVASKFPIVASTFIPFCANGLIERVWEGDGYCNKGVVVSKVLVPKSRLCEDKNGGFASSISMAEDVSSSMEVIVFNVHLIARYQRYSKLGGYELERNSADRLAQVHQMAQLIVSIAVPGVTPFIICGDFNAEVDSPELKLLRAYLQAHGLPIADAVRGPTCCADNTYHVGTKLFGLFRVQDDWPLQIDHIFYGRRDLAVVDGSNRVSMKDPVTIQPGLAVHLSDHYACEASFLLRTQPFQSPGLRSLAVFSLSQEETAALSYASDFLQRRATAKFALVWTMTGCAIAVAMTACVGLPYFVGGHYATPAVALVVGVAAWTMAVLGHFNRWNRAIAMQSAARDLKRLLQFGSAFANAEIPSMFGSRQDA